MNRSDFWHKANVVVTGGLGFLGSHVMSQLRELGASPISCSRRSGADLRDLNQAQVFFEKTKPDIVINCASKQGGIGYQKLYPASIYYENILMGSNTMEAARRAGVGKYVNIIAGCAYPGEPHDGILREDEFDAGPMHPTVDNYGMTKRAAVMQAEYSRRQYGFNALSLILINLYGPGEHFHPDRSHAMAALIRKFHEAKVRNDPQVTLWGTGVAVREWLFVQDAAEGIVKAAESDSDVRLMNIATGVGYTIAELADIVKEVTGYGGPIVYDTTKPDGALRKVADTTRMKTLLGWEPRTTIRDGIRQTLAWFIANYDEATKAKDDGSA